MKKLTHAQRVSFMRRPHIPENRARIVPHITELTMGKADSIELAKGFTLIKKADVHGKPHFYLTYNYKREGWGKRIFGEDASRLVIFDEKGKVIKV